MRRLVRWLFRLFILSVLVILGIVIFNSYHFNSRQIKIEAIPSQQIDDAVVTRLSQAVQIPTVSYEDHIDTSAFLRFQSFVGNTFPLTDSLLEFFKVNEYSFVYRWQGRNSNLAPVLLMAHIDVVPVETKSQGAWTHPPYSGKVADGYIWGRGTLDDKVNILASLEAIELLLKQNYNPERTIYLACGHDEEVSGQAGAKAIARRFEQQGLQFEYIMDEGSVILNEALPGLSKPLALIGVAEKGYTTLQLTARLPEGGHSSMPPQATAIGILSAALVKLQQTPFPASTDGPVNLLLEYAGPEMSQPFKAVMANRWLFNGMLIKQMSKAPTSNAALRTTAAPTMIESGLKDNVLPTEASATINLRIRPGETVKSVKEYIIDIINDERIAVAVKNHHFSSEPSRLSEVERFGFRVIEKTARQIFADILVAPAPVVAATDSRHFSALSPNIYRFFPVILDKSDLKRIHGIDERIGVDAYKDVVRFYHQLIINSCK